MLTLTTVACSINMLQLQFTIVTTVACTLSVYYASSSINLASATNINYDYKVRCKLKRTFTIATRLWYWPQY